MLSANARPGLPKFSRIWLIAMRDFIGYVKTWGFWLSFLFPVIGGIFGFMMQQSDFDLSPPRVETVIDQTGVHGRAILDFYAAEQAEDRAEAVKAMALSLPEAEREAFRERVDRNGPDAALAELQDRYPGTAGQIELPEPSLIFVDPPADSLPALMPWLEGERRVAVNGRDSRLNGVIVIRGTADAPEPQYWSRNFNNAPAERLVNRYFRDKAERRYLEAAGLSPEGFDAALDGRTRVDVFDPAVLSGGTEEDASAVSVLDRLPFFAGIGLSFFLLMTIFAGSFMLLTSMIEEKMNKLLEMMLASTRFSEIMLGKMLGAAMLTLASLAPYLILGLGALVGFLFLGTPEQVAAIREALPLSTILISLTFLLLGYVFYASILIALGALAQSMQDAQTLSLPIMLVMFMGLGVIMFGINAPDSPVIVFASIFPLTSPFAMMIRLASDPPVWQVALSIGLLAASVVGVMWVCARVFRFGVLSGSGVGAITGWFRRTVLRRAA
ncbi:ABC transporter permease [uncultured Algimonas sp.]|uniref:ABC transporter permease n=1 Tax=uncultured Algimonas sp. TaxID=1547920 RepID=UPI0026076536|nr:ABC transporter permease [uncultured Algimonas sp.]